MRWWIPLLLSGAAAATWAQGVGMSKDAPPRPSPAVVKTQTILPKPQVIAAAVTTPGQIEKAAILRAAGFTLRGGAWRSAECDAPADSAYTPGSIERYEDINGDGRPDALVTEESAFCYGMAGTAFWLVSQEPDGKWSLLTQQTGVAGLLKTRGVGGWPDLEVGGPGFCFPVLRWNGRTYALNRHEYEGKACTA